MVGLDGGCINIGVCFLGMVVIVLEWVIDYVKECC